jgi:hypothetical protein
MENYNIGDVVETKKQHPCGSKEWKIKRIGVDFKLECMGCGHEIMLERQKALKIIKKKITKIGTLAILISLLVL